MPSVPARPSSLPRLLSWFGDWLVVSAGIVALTVVSVVARALGVQIGTGQASTAGGVLVADAAFTMITTLPYYLYLALTETSRHHATVGKRWARLVVVAPGGGWAAPRAVWLRNLVKVLPWQLAHMGVTRAVAELQVTLSTALFFGALLVAAACALPPLIGRPGVHDLLARTRVTRRDA